MLSREIHAFIGVWYEEGKTFYVRRSRKMANYPGVWSLLSIQFEPSSYQEQLDPGYVQSFMEQMSRERLGGVGIRVVRFLSSAHCMQNPMNAHVFLHMYSVELDEMPRLNPEYYEECAWMTPEEYMEKSTGSACGLCLRMWSDYSVRHRLAAQSFAPELVAEA